VFQADSYTYNPEGGKDGTYEFFEGDGSHFATWLPISGWRIQTIVIPPTAVPTPNPNQVN
jgi:hypothetical protein